MNFSTKIKFREEELHEVDDFIYLGSEINHKTEMHKEINEWIQNNEKHNFIKSLICNHETSEIYKLTILYFKATLTYGAEICILTDKGKVQYPAE